MCFNDSMSLLLLGFGSFVLMLSDILMHMRKEVEPCIHNHVTSHMILCTRLLLFSEKISEPENMAVFCTA